MATAVLMSGEMPITVQQSVPTTGGTVVAAGGLVNYVLLEPAGTLATLTLTLPSSPVNGQRCVVSTTQIITALTVGGGTIIGTLTTLVLGGFAEFLYSSDSSKWFRVG